MNNPNLKLKLEDILKYAEKSINTSISLRKVKDIVIEQESREYHARPQHHTMIVSPFGTFKTATLKQIKETVGEDAVAPDSFTIPSFYGTITKNGDFVKGIIFNCGGKVLLIDEYNNLKYDVQTSMLSILETQQIERALGFVLRREVKEENEFIRLHAYDNMIKGEVNFSVIAFSMNFHLYTQKLYALLSRFSPVFLQMDAETARRYLKGAKLFNIEDSAKKCIARVPKQDWYEFVDFSTDYLKTNLLYPQEIGFYNRATNDAVRFALHSLLTSIKDTEINKELIITYDLLKLNFPYFLIQLQMYQQAPRTKADMLLSLLEVYPDKSYEFYAEMLGTTPKYVEKLFYELRNLKLRNGEKNGS